MFHKYYRWRQCLITKLPKYFIENPNLPFDKSKDNTFLKLISPKYVFYIYIYIYIYFTQYLQWLTTKSFLTFSLSNISKLNLNQNTNLNHNFKINQTRKKKKEKKREEDKANLTHLSYSGEANKRWWGRGQACVNIRRRSLCV